MHLVVLRKHSIPLPEKLPACLVPQVGAPAAEEGMLYYDIHGRLQGICQR